MAMSRRDRRTGASGRSKEAADSLDLHAVARRPSAGRIGSNRAALRLQQQRTGAGSRLDDETRAFMESRFGAGFGDVRVHNGPAADLAAQSVSADAFTSGADIFFRNGTFGPRSATGRHLLAHELAHVVQQREGTVAGGGRGTLGPLTHPHEPCEVQAEHAADRIMGTGRTGTEPTTVADGLRTAGAGGGTGTASMQPIMRRATTVPAPFIGGSPFNDSSVTFTPTGGLFANGFLRSFTDFPDASVAEVEINAGTSGVVALSCNVRVFEDNMFINETWDQAFSVSWDVTAARDGALTISSTPTPTINNPSSSNHQSALGAINAASGSNFVQVSPMVLSGGASGGISIGVGLTTNYPGSTVQRSFRLNVKVVGIPAAPALRSYQTEVLFERPGQDRVSSEAEARVIRWYEGLPADLKAAVEAGAVQVDLIGSASTTGDPQRNRELSARRSTSVQEILAHYAGSKAVFRNQAVGEYRASTVDDVEDPYERRVVIKMEYTPTPVAAP